MAIIYTCSAKCSVSLARKKIRLDFQSMKVCCPKMTKERKKNAHLHKFSLSYRCDHDVRPSTNVYKLFALNWLGITVPRDNFLWNGRFGPNIAGTNSYSFVRLGETSRRGTIIYNWKGIWLFKIMKIILFS